MNESSGLELDREDGDGAEVVRARGELDLTNADELSAAIQACTAGSVVLDLSSVLFVDSAGVRAIDSEHARLARSGRSLLVVAPPASRAAWTFRVAGFSDDFVVDSLEAAAERAASPAGS